MVLTRIVITVVVLFAVLFGLATASEAAGAAKPKNPEMGFPLEVCAIPTRVEIDVGTQSIYVYKKNKLLRAELGRISTTTLGWKNHRIRGRIKPKQPLGCFKIERKNLRAYSKAYGVWMERPVWFWGPGLPHNAYAIHCVPKGKESKLGRPDSGGCVRTSHGFCEWFYQWVNQYVPVYIFGEWVPPKRTKK